MADTIDYSRRLTLLSQLVAQPAAGADFSVAVPAGVVWRVRTLFAKLVCSATVANRLPTFFIKDASGNIVYWVPATFNTAASQTGTYTMIEGGPLTNGNTNGVLPLPVDVVLPEGWTISTNTSGIQTGDQWQNIALLVEQGNAL